MAFPKVLSRIAPTPSGYLHTGNAINFLLVSRFVRKVGGRLLLRIDDCDAGRSRPAFIEDIFSSLEWLGIEWDIGPSGPDDFFAHFSQSARRERYLASLEKLIASGRVYNCFCSRASIRQQFGDAVYPGLCRGKGLAYTAGKTARRIVVDRMAEFAGRSYDLAAAMGDFVVWTKEDMPAYQLASLVDDEEYGVTHIFRGDDLLLSSVAQRYLAEELGYRTFLQTKIFHHPLLLDDNGQKLSKSDSAVSLRDLRESGMTRAELLQRLDPFLQQEFISELPGDRPSFPS